MLPHNPITWTLFFLCLWGVSKYLICGILNYEHYYINDQLKNLWGYFWWWIIMMRISEGVILVYIAMRVTVWSLVVLPHISYLHFCIQLNPFFDTWCWNLCCFLFKGYTWKLDKRYNTLCLHNFYDNFFMLQN